MVNIQRAFVMDMISRLPDESWSDEKIIELLDANVSGLSANKKVRVVCLDVLRKRKAINRVNQAIEVLLKAARVCGTSTPESFMIIELISRLANSEEDAFNKLYDKMMIYKDDNSLYCFAKITRNLEDMKKGKCASRLLLLLMNCDSFTDTTDEMYQTLITIGNEDINKEIVKATIPYLRFPDSFKVVYAVAIASRLASRFMSGLELVLERTLNGWYNAYRVKILKDVCNFLKRIKDRKAIPYLLQVLKSGFENEVVPKALASIIDAHPETINQIWEFLEEDKEHYPFILEAFAEMETNIDLERLFSVVDIDLNKWRPERALKKIMIKAGEQAKPSLFEMIRDKEQVRYTFAVECLDEIGVSIEEYSKVFDKSPILQVIEFFHRKRKSLLLENLWKEQDKMGNSIKNAQMDNFEYFIHHFFSALGFVTMFLDPPGKEGVDLVAFHPNRPYILVIGCTTGIIKGDLQKMSNTLIDMEEALEGLFAKYKVLPVIITSKKAMITAADSECAGGNGIAILTQEETTKLLDMLRANRGSEEIIKQIESSIPLPDYDNPYDRL